MNWKLIFQLSLFGLAMGLATVFVIPSKVEPAFWVAIFAVCAYFIATRCPTLRFAHGQILGLVNCVWVTGAHVLFFNRYVASHAREAAMMKTMPLPGSPRLMMVLMGPTVGIISGAIIGAFAVVAGILLNPPKKPSSNPA
jgi:hypothetical protein